MARIPGELTGLLRGPLLETGDWPLLLTARLCDLCARFISKDRVGHSYLAIARNGHVFLAADRPLTELAGAVAKVRFQTWHKTPLPGDRLAPWGVLLSLRSRLALAEPQYAVRLGTVPDESAALVLDVGGGMVLEFRGVA